MLVSMVSVCRRSPKRPLISQRALRDARAALCPRPVTQVPAFQGFFMETAMHRPQLNNRQERFVHEFIKDQNASAAALRAGYSGKSHGAQAHNLMSNPLVQERISLALGDMYAKLDITATHLLREESRIAFFDPRKLYQGGKPVPLEELDEDCAAAIGVSYTEKADGAVTKRVRQLSKQQALNALERRYGKFLEMQLALLQGARAPETEPEPPPLRKPERGPWREPVLDVQRMKEAAAPAAAPSAVAADSDSAPPEPSSAMPVDVVPALEPAMESTAPPEPTEPTPPKYKVSAFRQAMDEAYAQSDAKAAREAIEAGLPPPAPKGPPDPNAPYDFRKDPNWMWGGRTKPVPPPEKGWVELEAEANAQWRKQNAELLANTRHLRVRPGAAIMPARMEPGYNPPWLRRDRPAVGDPGPVFYDDED